MEYMSCPEAAEKWGISERRVQILCKENRIPGVSKIGYMWLIGPDAVYRKQWSIMSANRNVEHWINL